MWVRDIQHHHVHTGQLRPDLGEHADVSAVDHVGFEEVEVAGVGVIALKLAHLADLAQLGLDEDGVAVTLGVDQGQGLVALLPAVLLGQPSRALGHKEEGEEEDHGGDHLQTPRQTPGGGASEEAASVGDVEHDQDLLELACIGERVCKTYTPGNGPLLGTDDGSTLTGLGQLGDIDRNLGTADTHGDAVDEAADNQLADAERGAGNGTANTPDDGTGLDSPATAKRVGDDSRS